MTVNVAFVLFIVTATFKCQILFKLRTRKFALSLFQLTTSLESRVNLPLAYWITSIVSKLCDILLQLKMHYLYRLRFQTIHKQAVRGLTFSNSDKFEWLLRTAPCTRKCSESCHDYAQFWTMGVINLGNFQAVNEKHWQWNSVQGNIFWEINLALLISNHLFYEMYQNVIFNTLGIRSEGSTRQRNPLQNFVVIV